MSFGQKPRDFIYLQTLFRGGVKISTGSIVCEREPPVQAAAPIRCNSGTDGKCSFCGGTSPDERNKQGVQGTVGAAGDFLIFAVSFCPVVFCGGAFVFSGAMDEENYIVMERLYPPRKGNV